MSENFPAQPLEVLPYGLLSLRDPTVTDDDKWLAGFDYESLSCSTEVNLLDICGGHDPLNVNEPNNDFRFLFYQPFTIEAIDRCTTFGYLKHDVEARAVAALEACTQQALERELWTGAIATANGYTTNRFLASPDSQNITPGSTGDADGTAVKIRYGLALLEGALASCGCGTRGTIHVTHDVASALQLKAVDNHLETAVGNYVVAGSGYTGTGPDGATPATGQWIYATGPVNVRLGRSLPIGDSMAQQVDRTNNTWEVHAERPAAITWDGCCAFAVHVDLALDYQ